MHLRVRRQRAGEELDVADELGAARNRRRDERLVLRNTRADRDQVGAGNGGVGERTRHYADFRVRSLQPVGERRRRPRVGDAHRGAAHGEMTRKREPGEPEAQHDCVASRVIHHRSFKLDSPNSTSSIVMIQKRTTTWFSFHPLSS